MQYRPQPPFTGRPPAASFDGIAGFPAGCLVSVGAMTLFGAMAALVVLAVMVPGYRSSAAYRETMARVNEDPRAAAALGTPIRETALIAFQSKWNEQGVDRKITLQVAGPKAGGRLAAEARETDEGVQIVTWTLSVDQDAFSAPADEDPVDWDSGLPRKQRPL